MGLSNYKCQIDTISEASEFFLPEIVSRVIIISSLRTTAGNKSKEIKQLVDVSLDFQNSQRQLHYDH